MIILSLQVAVRTLSNTDWPVELVVERQNILGRTPYWIVYEVCNGIASGTTRFATRKAAIAYAEERKDEDS